MEYAYAQQIGQAKLATQINAWDAILSASPIVQLTLLSLIAMSVISWAIIFSKRKYFLASQKDNALFLDAFWKSTSLDSLNEKIGDFQSSNLATVFKAGFQELQKIAESNLSKSTSTGAQPQLIGIDNLSRALRKAEDLEIEKMEKQLNFLATTGSTGPFIGLFGTVWGIMGAFQKIGASGSASLAVVAPGISEALIATAIGLAAAIPAVMAYNHFVSRVKKQEIEMNGFSADFLNIAKRNFFRGE